MTTKNRLSKQEVLEMLSLRGAEQLELFARARAVRQACFADRAG